MGYIRDEERATSAALACLTHFTMPIGQQAAWNQLAKLAEVEIARDPPALKQWYDLLGKAYSATGQTKKADEAYRKEASLPDLPAD